jgi:DNA end-binding protein Ku
MPRAIWKGSIGFGLVTVPVALHSATDTELTFRLLHKTDQSPVEYKRFCKEEDKEVAWSEIVKGYEIQDFVPGEAIPDIYFDHPYYLAPTGKGAAKAYALFRDALAKSGRVGIGTIVLRQRAYLAAVEPVGRRRPRVIDLMDALKASLEKGRKAPVKAGAPRAGARRRGQRRAA